MSFILEAENGQSVTINAWNWRPTLELLREAQVIDELTYELMGANGCGGQVDADTARRIADFIDVRLATMKPGERIRADLSITSAPKPRAVLTPDGSGDAIDSNELYSATYQWLIEFRDFSRASGGFKVH